MSAFTNEYQFKDNIMKLVCQNMRKYRILRGMTQEELAEYIGISHEYIRRVETQNGSKGLSFETIYKISVVLDVTIDQLIEEEDK